jgi:hypothetical protein
MTATHLDVPYFSQEDDGADGWRHCQSSSIAMVLAYHKLAGIHDDLNYFRIMSRFGDTTSQAAHMAALKSLGVDAVFRTSLTAEKIREHVSTVGPVVVGVLHHGLPSHPSGGGHFIVIRGWDEDGWWVNDPYGSLGCATGQWDCVGGNSGKDQHYSYKNFSPRMFVEGDGSCWGWLIYPAPQTA